MNNIEIKFKQVRLFELLERSRLNKTDFKL